MDRCASRILIAIGVAALALTAVSCKARPGAESPDVVVAQDATGATVVRLAGVDRHRKWKLKDEKHDILVMRREGGFFDVNVSVTLPNGGIRRVTTQIKASPGQTIPLGGRGDARITFTQSG